MNAQRTFTVIIPAHNKGPHLQRSISSVVNQIFSDFELIIIDDASTDGSREEIEKFQDPRIRLFHRDRPGPGGYAARNLGIREAKGKWIAFLDADDEWMPEHLQKMIELASQFPDCDFLSCGWMNVTATGRLYPDPYFGQNSGGGAREISLAEYLQLCIREMRPTCTNVVCLRNNAIVQDIFPEGRVGRGGDLHAWIFHLAKGKKMAWSPHVGAVYYRDAVNMVTKSASGNPASIRMLMGDLVPWLDHEHKKLLSMLGNRWIWDVWKANLFIEPYESFNLAASFSWKGDFFFCAVRSAIAVIPVSVFRYARWVKRAILNRRDPSGEYHRGGRVTVVRRGVWSR